MNTYTFTLNSDTGKHKITVFDQTLAKAIEQVLNHELAPERAILNIAIKYAKS